jgi:hypothetical protein
MHPIGDNCDRAASAPHFAMSTFTTRAAAQTAGLSSRIRLPRSHQQSLFTRVGSNEIIGKRVEVAMLVVVQFDGDKLAHEHLYSDQASVLVQLELLQPEGLPVIGAAGEFNLVPELNCGYSSRFPKLDLREKYHTRCSNKMPVFFKIPASVQTEAHVRLRSGC